MRVRDFCIGAGIAILAIVFGLVGNENRNNQQALLERMDAIELQLSETQTALQISIALNETVTTQNDNLQQQIQNNKIMHDIFVEYMQKQME